MFKRKISKILKRTISAVSAAVLIATNIISASAVQVTYDWDNSDNPIFTKSIAAVNDGIGSITANKSKIVPFKVKGEKYYAMCVLPGTGFAADYRDIDGVVVIPNMDEYGNYWENWYRDSTGEWKKDISTDQKSFIALCSYYGYPHAKENISYFYATQLLSWEIIMGYRTCNRDDSSSFSKSYNNVKLKNCISCSSAQLNSIKKAYDDLEEKVTLHYTRPSALSATGSEAESNAISMTYDWNTKKYSATFNIENEYMDSSSPSNYRNIIKDLKNEGFTVSYSEGAKNTKITVSYSKAFKGKKTVYIARTTDPVPPKFKAKIYKKYGDQTLALGTVDPDPYWGFISFKLQDQPNIKVEKQYKTADGELLTGVELDSALADTQFRIRKTIGGVKNYVAADYDNANERYVFSHFTTNPAAATAFHTVKTSGTKGTFAVLDLPSKKNASVSYALEEISSAAGYGTASATFSVPPYTDNKTQTIKLVNNGADYGTVDMHKSIIDAAGDSYDLTDRDTAQDMQSVYRKTAFVVGVKTADGMKYLTNRAISKDVELMPDHVLKGTGAEIFAPFDGKYYSYVTIKNGSASVDFESNALTDDISQAALIYPGSELTESGDELTPCEYFGGLHIECVPCDKSGNTVPLLFIEVGHAENYGYDDLDKNEAKDISFFDRCTSSEFENFNGLVKYPAGTKVGSYELNADSCYPAAAAATDKSAGQNKYADTEIVNRYYHASLVVTKRDSDTEEPVSGAVYGLYAAKDDLSSLISTAITDENGKARFDTAAAANTVYYIKEIESPKGYALDNEWHEIVFAPGNIEQNLVLDSDFGDFGTDTQDEPYKLDIVITKKDGKNDIPVKDAEFDVITDQALSEKETAKLCDDEYKGKAYAAGDVIGKIKTDENGAAEYYGLPLGRINAENPDVFNYTYTLIETYVPAPYVLDSTPYTVTTYVSDISADKTAEKGIALAAETSDIVNYPQNVDLTVIKKSDSDKPLEGVVFNIYAKDDVVLNGHTIQTAGELVGTLSPTDSEGKAYSVYTKQAEDGDMGGDYTYRVPIYPGFKYTISEDPATVPEYYEPLSEPIEFTAEYGGNSISTVELTKTIVNYEKSGSIEVHKTTKGMLNLSGIGFTLSGTSDAGTEVNKYVVTDENGIALFEHIPVGTYEVTEDGSTTPYAYLTADPVAVEVYYAETTTQEIHNDEKTGSIEVHKTTEGMLNLSGIDFVLSGTSDSGRDISITATTDKNGIAKFENVPIGTYDIIEDGKTTPYAYLTADPVAVEVYYAETTTQEIHNDEKTGSIEVHKTTKGMTNLSGIDFILSGTSDSGRDISITATTDEKGIAKFENIPIGTYTITESGKTVPYGYLVADPESVEVLYAETITAEIYNDTTKVKLSKQDITTGKELPGAKLQVIDKDGKVVEEWVSTNEPHYLEGVLAAGETYKLHEVIAPDGYEIANDVTFTVASDGKVQTVVMKDELTPTTPPSTPPTDTPPATGTAAVSVIVTLGAVCILLLSKKEKSSK